MGDEVNATPWALAVAAELGDRWTAQPGRGNGQSAHLVGPKGARVHVVMGGYQLAGRVELSWRLPPELTEHAPSGTVTNRKITVADSTSPRLVARDITRRLLPGLVELLELVTQRKADSDKADVERDAFLDEINSILGGEKLTYAVDRLRFGSYNVLPTGDVRVMPSDVEMELRLTRDQTKVIAWALAKIQSER
ncbi:MAG TPA: hypothetical protein VGD73_31360 [Pseudonocardia sp.]|uniref:hypothetical protein n=1 Tax=Pseudonocardia sp. TaxID=60912 RepID=UPI002EDB725C